MEENIELQMPHEAFMFLNSMTEHKYKKQIIRSKTTIKNGQTILLFGPYKESKTISECFRSRKKDGKTTPFLFAEITMNGKKVLQEISRPMGPEVTGVRRCCRILLSPRKSSEIHPYLFDITYMLAAESDEPCFYLGFYPHK